MLNYGSRAFIWYGYRICRSKTLFEVIKLQKFKYVIFVRFQKLITPQFWEVQLVYMYGIGFTVVGRIVSESISAQNKNA